MTLDTSGLFLEGVKLASGNGPLTFPPRSVVTDTSAFESQELRAEYVLLASSTDPVQRGIEIADPNLRFLWSRNESSVARFDYDVFGRRWFPMPGGPPDILGVITNSPRISGPVPDPSITSAPFSFYVGSPSRLVTFVVVFVPDPGSFSSPASLPSGTMEICQSDGSLNFSETDLIIYAGQDVLCQRQSFFNRTQRNGSVGSIPSSPSAEYFIFMNPRPGTGQNPLIRIGHGAHLIGNEVPDEASLGSPGPGTFNWSLDTGRIRLSEADVLSHLLDTVYYDGLTIGSIQVVRTTAGPALPFPSASFTIPQAIGISDVNRFVVYAELTGQARRYFNVKLIEGLPSKPPSNGSVAIDITSGSVYVSLNDAISNIGRTFSWLDSVVAVERGVSIQLYRSGVNSSGESQGPDFNVRYGVTDQIIQDGITQSPFIMLPVVPVDDSSLLFSVAPAPSSTGTYVGLLKDGGDPANQGLCRILDLDARQIKFGNRKTVEVVVRRPSPMVKIPDGAVSSRGLEVSKNGTPLTPGTDFSFDPATGLIEFLESVGESGSNDRSGVTGQVTLPNTFTAQDSTFFPDDVGRALLIRSGDNQGYYVITDVLTSRVVEVDKTFASDGPDSVDVRDGGEDVIDRFWSVLLPPFKKISVSRASSPAGPYTEIPNTKFTVLPTTGQVNLGTPASPGESFQISYISLDSDDNGVTVNPTNRLEKALFKVRQEQGVTTDGSRIVSFNPLGSTINTARPIVVYLDGVTQDSAGFQFSSPGTLTLANPIISGQVVYIDYWVEDAPGGNTSFNLLFTPVDVDFPSIISGSDTASLNGDQRSVILPGSGFLIANNAIAIARSVAHDSTSDVTTITFESPPTVGSENATIMACGPVDGGFRVAESAQASMVPKGTNVLYLAGRQSYEAGMIVTLDLDPYYVTSATYDDAAVRTVITFGTPARRNYIIPSITKTIRPILLPGSSFKTSRPASASAPFTLVRMGSNRKVLVQGVDYNMAEGGAITLSEPLSYGDSLHALYVARVPQSTGTVFTINYAYAIAPGPSNGLQGQRLLASYDLYAPDSFFYRIETFYSLLPEAQSLLQSSSDSGGGGPDTASRTGMSSKDFGLPSLYFPEQSARNLDEIFSRLLLFYNDLVNQYEDVLTGMDGRVVGGISGRFRFDGKTDNPPRNDYDDVTNDVDDKVRGFNKLVLTGLNPFELQSLPVYINMAQPNRISRLFPQFRTVTVAIGDNVGFDANGEDMGSTGATNIIMSLLLRTAKANSEILEIDQSGTVLTIPENGNVELLLPEFKANQIVKTYEQDGTEASVATIQSVSTTAPIQLFVLPPVSRRSASVMHATEEGDTTVKFYTAGRDLIIDADSGNIVNVTLPPPLNAIQNIPQGNELLDVPLIFLNSDTSPFRIPVLDGLELMDDGRVSQPRLTRPSEESLLQQELDAMSTLGRAAVEPVLNVISGVTIPLLVGLVIRFINGPNSGLERQVAAIIGSGTYLLNSMLPSSDSSGSDFIATDPNLDAPTIDAVVQREIKVIGTGISGPLSSPTSLLHDVDSELVAAGKAIMGFGTEVVSGNGSLSGVILTDSAKDFSIVTSSDLLYVTTGGSTGLYKILSSSSSTITIDPTAPYSSFPSSGPASYIVIKPWELLGTANFDIMSEYLRETYAFYASTVQWMASLSESGKATREAALSVRLSRLDYFIGLFEGLLDGGEQFYELRYLIIDQRANRKEGTLASAMQAATTRASDEVKIRGDAKKLLLTRKLIGS